MNDALIALQKGGTPVISVMDAVEVFIKDQNSVSTAKAYAFDLRTWFGWLGGTEIVPTKTQAVDFKVWLAQKYAGTSAARIFNTCRAFYRFVGGFNPFESLKSPKRVRNSTPEVPDDLLVIKMLELVDNDRDRLILTLLLNGLRRSEVASLRTNQIKYDSAYNAYIIKVIGKGNKERLVVANMETATAIKQYDFEWGDHEGWVFPMFDHPDMEDHITNRTIEYVSEKWSKKAGKKTSPHKFRHHYATRMIRAGAKLLSLSDMLGHESVATTQIYVTLDMADRVEAAALDPLNRKVSKE